MASHIAYFGAMSQYLQTPTAFKLIMKSNGHVTDGDGLNPARSNLS